MSADGPAGGRPLDVLTWHVNGSYLNYLASCGHTFWVPVLPGRPARFGGRPPEATWPDNVQEVRAQDVAGMDFDAILYQHRANWTTDRFEWLTERQLDRIPQAFLEHDPPRAHPTDAAHCVEDPRVPIVHVTHFNQLMWDCGPSPSVVIEHGVKVPDDAVWSGHVRAGISVVNNIVSRGRHVGPDILERFAEKVPVELIGMGSREAGGIGEVAHHLIPYEVAAHRFFFSPIRYTSLGLAVCEALMTGTPVVGLATTEMSVAIENGVNGFVDTDLDRLTDSASALLEDHSLASRLSAAAREQARERYGIERFAAEWDAFLRDLAA